ncbi:hypothetical protein H7H82_06810 [Mycobacterium heidelbergense]|uniref:hypothetical protein n=1 Tax=Mycobacterium heidelbergense TaxID=53376 RepID=UPI00138C7481|nr:hypothetical protein [Mycobacterium heidelbergense]MCV7050313.1 hypothetical protein [Mycobacterium heidelbergense]BBZ50543.1 hypothetical protein MHEI_22600 [Mycobacterium heidelbergense]
MALLREARDDLRALIGATAAHLGIDQIFVEKDFLVTEVLRAATVPVDVVDQGGARHAVEKLSRLVDRGFSGDLRSGVLVAV